MILMEKNTEDQWHTVKWLQDFVMWPVRTAVSGKQMTPGGETELMELLGKEESLKRINDAIVKLEAALA